jgi:hypothetical protein
MYLSNFGTNVQAAVDNDLELKVHSFVTYCFVFSHRLYNCVVFLRCNFNFGSQIHKEASEQCLTLAVLVPGGLCFTNLHNYIKFQTHRILNFLALALMLVGLLTIFIAHQWRWLGPVVSHK